MMKSERFIENEDSQCFGEVSLVEKENDFEFCRDFMTGFVQ